MKITLTEIRLYKVGFVLIGLLLTLVFGLESNATPNHIFHVPKNLSSNPAPLFVVLHGCDSVASEIEAGSQFSTWADKNGFFVLYPELEDPNTTLKCWNYFLPEEQKVNSGEPIGIIQTIEELKKQYPIDPKQIFLVGMSAGSSQAANLASCYPDFFAGAAYHSGISYGLSSNWQEALWVLNHGPIPFLKQNAFCRPSDFKGKVMIFQGSIDMLVSPTNYAKLAIDFLGDTQVNSTEVNPGSGKYQYLKNDFRRKGELVGQGYYVWGMNHAWSGGQGKDIFTDANGPDATSLIIDFFTPKQKNR